MLLRRSISLTLCWLLLLPSLFAMRGPAKPECCLRNGAHHCDGIMDGMQMDGDGDSVQALNVCPYSHAPTKFGVNAFVVVVSLRNSAAAVSECALPGQRTQEFETAVMERSSRGPPAIGC